MTSFWSGIDVCRFDEVQWFSHPKDELFECYINDQDEYENWQNLISPGGKISLEDFGKLKIKAMDARGWSFDKYDKVTKLKTVASKQEIAGVFLCVASKQTLKNLRDEKRDGKKLFIQMQDLRNFYGGKMSKCTNDFSEKDMEMAANLMFSFLNPDYSASRRRL